MSDKQQTAIDWLIEQWPILESDLPDWLIQQAKEIEKEQIVNAVDDRFNYDSWSSSIPTLGEQYYNETYGGKKQ
jgi:hypothetical protein